MSVRMSITTSLENTMRQMEKWLQNIYLSSHAKLGPVSAERHVSIYGGVP